MNELIKVKVENVEGVLVTTSGRGIGSKTQTFIRENRWLYK